MIISIPPNGRDTLTRHLEGVFEGTFEQTSSLASYLVDEQAAEFAQLIEWTKANQRWLLIESDSAEFPPGAHALVFGNDPDAPVLTSYERADAWAHLKRDLVPRRKAIGSFVARFLHWLMQL
jgi:hypothetical protein